MSKEKNEVKESIKEEIKTQGELEKQAVMEQSCEVDSGISLEEEVSEDTNLEKIEIKKIKEKIKKLDIEFKKYKEITCTAVNDYRLKGEQNVSIKVLKLKNILSASKLKSNKVDENAKEGLLLIKRQINEILKQYYKKDFIISTGVGLEKNTFNTNDSNLSVNIESEKGKLEEDKNEHIKETDSETIQKSENIDAVEVKVEQDGKVDGINSKVNEYHSLLERKTAEFNNYKKRTCTSITEAEEAGETTVLLEIIKVLDIVDIAISMFIKRGDNIPKQLSLIKEQIELILVQFETIEIKALGHSFDPNYHNAIQQEETDGEKNSICEVYQKGFERKGKVIRYTMVKVTC